MTNTYRSGNSKKKSEFVASTTIPDDSYIDYVYNGVNRRIKLTDFLTSRTLSGALTQDGAVTGTPVLDISGATYNIRNLEDGPGVKASVSAENGITLEHDFEADTTGIATLINLTTKPKARSLLQGSGISLGVVNGSIQIALSATPTTTKTVIINEISDFPTAIGGIITLEDDTQYFLTNDMTTSDRFVLGSDTVVTGSDGTLITLTYTGSNVMFTSVDNSNKIRDIALIFASGTLLDISCSACTNLFQMVSCRCTGDEIGTIDNMYVSNFQNMLWDITTDGLTFTNNNSIISFTQNVGGITAGNFVELGTSTFDGFSFTNSFGVLGAGATFISGAADSANVNTGGLGTVINTRALGTGTALSGITTTDSLWEFTSNSGIANSRNTLLATNAGATVTIAAINTPVIIGATWVMVEESRFSGTAGGRFTYTGTGSYVSLHASISATISTGINIQTTFYFFKNGTEITASAIEREFSSGIVGNISMLWGDELETGDYIEIFAENNDTTADIVVSNAIVRFD